MRDLPEKLVIIGGGVIAIELAFAMAPLGVEVTVIEVAPEILLTEEAEARRVIQKETKKMGVMIYQGAQIKEVTGNSVLLENEQVAFDHLLIATGRKTKSRASKGYGISLDRTEFCQGRSILRNIQRACLCYR